MVTDDDGEDPPDPECYTKKTESACKDDGCSWTAAFDGEMVEDGQGTEKVKGYVCADDEELEEEENDKPYNMEVTGEAAKETSVVTAIDLMGVTEKEPNPKDGATQTSKNQKPSSFFAGQQANLVDNHNDNMETDGKSEGYDGLEVANDNKTNRDDKGNNEYPNDELDIPEHDDAKLLEETTATRGCRRRRAHRRRFECPYARRRRSALGTCKVRMPTGCNKALSETTTPTQWFFDPLSSSSALCSARLGNFNAYCGKTDAVSQWNVNQPGTACWVRMPTGCNKALSETTTPTQWFVDPLSSSSGLCSARLGDFNTYCGKTDAVSQWTVKKPQTASAPAPAPAPAPAGGACEDPNVNDFSSKSSMEAAGWSFINYHTKYGFKPAAFGKNVPANSFWGFHHPGVMELQRTLQGSGSVTVTFGNQHQSGKVNVYLNGVVKGSATGHQYSQTVSFAYSAGDVLKLGEPSAAVMILSSVKFTCDATAAIPTTSPPTPASTTVPTLIQPSAGKWALDKHNSLRCLHCDTPVLTWDATLASQAAACAAGCPTGHTCDTQGAGENLFWAGSTGTLVENQASWEQAIQSFYDEIKDWSFASSSSTGGVTGHFTQLVWQRSAQLGCAMNTNCNNKFSNFKNIAVVCRYSPAGNFGSQYAVNVKNTVASGACGSASSTCDNGPTQPPMSSPPPTPLSPDGKFGKMLRDMNNTLQRIEHKVDNLNA
jgi:hypothetical protein